MASRKPEEYAFTPPLGGRDFHPHRDISYQGSFLVSYPPDKLVSEEHIARRDTCNQAPGTECCVGLGNDVSEAYTRR